VELITREVGFFALCGGALTVPCDKRVVFGFILRSCEKKWWLVLLFFSSLCSSGGTREVFG